MNKYNCPCCNNKTLKEKPPGTFEICSICLWEDDNVQFTDENYKGGANIISLKEAKMNYKKTKNLIGEKMIKTYKYNKLITIPLLIILYYSAIVGYIRLIQNIKNSMFPIVMDGIYAVIMLSIATKFIADILKTNITINDSYIKIIKSGKVTREIDLSKVNNIDYFEMPIFNFMNFLYIYEENKEFESIDFEIKNHFELYKEIVEKVKNNPNIQINEKLLKRLKNK